MRQKCASGRNVHLRRTCNVFFETGTLWPYIGRRRSQVGAERHPQEILNRLWWGLIRDLMGAKTERLILAFSFGGISLRALHQASLCISSSSSSSSNYSILFSIGDNSADAHSSLMHCPERDTPKRKCENQSFRFSSH